MCIRDRLKGVRTNDIIARIVTEETGQSVSPATVKRAIAAEKLSLIHI